MLINIADLVVHVDESLTREQLDRLEDAVRVNTCVVSAAPMTVRHILCWLATSIQCRKGYFQH